jgi:hypothetical protein
MELEKLKELTEKCQPFYETINMAIGRINMLSADVQVGSFSSEFNITFTGFEPDVVRSLLDVIENSQIAIKTIHNSYKQ